MTGLACWCGRNGSTTGAAALLDAGCGLTGLTTLVLDGNELTDSGALACTNNQALAELSLTWNRIGAQAVGPLRLNANGRNAFSTFELRHCRETF